MLDNRPVATGKGAPIKRSRSIVRDSGIPLSVRLFFRPSVLAFLALALTVGASGYGYKLSHYFHCAGVSKASPTRMWVDHRDESQAVLAHHQLKPERLPGLALLAAPTSQISRLSRDHVVIMPDPRHMAFLIPSNIPLRGPPSLHSS